jgi:hypothetical protein
MAEPSDRVGGYLQRAIEAELEAREANDPQIKYELLVLAECWRFRARVAMLRSCGAEALQGAKTALRSGPKPEVPRNTRVMRRKLSSDMDR